MRAYYFGVYHWRRRLRSLLLATGAIAVAVLFRRRWPSPLGTSLAVGSAIVAAVQGGRALAGTLSPPPWAIERYKYDALAARLPLDGSEAVLDVGCGTGRSLVGLAPSLAPSATVLGLDVFDDRVILGNGPGLARRNAALAGLDVTPIRGDAARLPVASGSQDVLTACRVLHDLPEGSVDPALGELRRVCAPKGVFGVLELPLTPAGVDCDPEAYWRERVLEAGFAIDRLDRIERRNGGDPYVVIVATPAPSPRS